MTKRSFRHWQKALRQSIIKITKRHIAVVVVKVMTIRKKSS
jgi:hypothetical protein